MTRIERWQNSETGEVYELEWPVLPPASDAPQAEPDSPQLPVAAVPPSEPSGAVLAPHREPQRLEPRRARLLARIMRQILEGPDDAA